MMGSEIFIMVALRWRETMMLFFFASVNWLSRNSRSVAALMTEPSITWRNKETKMSEKNENKLTSGFSLLCAIALYLSRLK